MTTENTIDEIVGRLRQGAFPNEQSISQGVVLRIFQSLGWDTWDTAVVWPEYQTGEGRADFALCHPASKPAIFIEVKQPGKAEDAVRQALSYAFHAGVPFVVLTDGRTWSFYLPAEQGSYEDRRVYKLDLFERSSAEAAGVLTKYLAKDRVEAGDALDDARREYRSKNRQEQARSAIPDAWRELVDKGDELLVELLASAVESKCGIRPNDDEVAEFLQKLRSLQVPASVKISIKSATTHAPRPAQSQVTPSSTRAGTLVLNGNSIAYQNAKEAMVIVLRELAKSDATFLQRCAQHPDAQGRKRRYIARTPEELYPDREDLREMREQLPGGWFVATNLNNVLKKTIIRLATEVAGLKFGLDVRVDF